MLQPCILFPKFLQAGISITTVLADGLKKEDGSVWCWHRASETSVLSQFCLGFQSPFLCKFKAWSCSSMFSGFTVLKSHISQVCQLICVVETTINLIIVFWFFKQRWLISKFLWERKGGNTQLSLLLLLVLGIQSVHPRQRMFLSWEVNYHHSTCTVVLHCFCKWKATVLSSNTLQDLHLHLSVSRNFLDLQIMPPVWCCAGV